MKGDESDFILDKDTLIPYLHTYYLMACVSPVLALSLA